MKESRSITATKRVSKHGSSLGLNLGREFEMLGVGHGDIVTVEIRKEER